MSLRLTYKSCKIENGTTYDFVDINKEFYNQRWDIALVDDEIGEEYLPAEGVLDVIIGGLFMIGVGLLCWAGDKWFNITTK